MFVMKNALKNIVRHIKRGILYLLICCIAVLTLQLYMSGINRTNTQLEELGAAMPVSANVASMDASRYEGLQIQDVTVEGLLNSTYIKDLNMTVLIRGTGLNATEKEREYPPIYITGANRAEALEGLEDENVTWAPGWDMEFLKGSDSACIIDKAFMESMGLEMGGNVSFEFYRYIYGNMGDITFESLGVREMTIAGATDTEYVHGVPHVIIPLELARQIHMDADTKFNASTASFYVKDATYLNEFKEEMKNISLKKPDFSGAMAMAVLANMGTALMVNDAAYISAATRLQESLSMLYGFLPVVIVVLALIGYFVAYLMIQSRSSEYAVMRLLGMGKSESVGMYFLEMAILTIFGSLVGTAIGLLTGVCTGITGLWVFFLFAVCFMGGSLIALWRLARTNVMLALTRAE